MLGGLLRLALVVIIVVATLAFFVGYRFSHGEIRGPAAESPVGTLGEGEGSGRDRGRDAGARVGEAVGAAGDRSAEALSDGALTVKIKGKMALDDVVSARGIDVDAVNGTVTLSGEVRTERERQRALVLARETEGVKSVNDRLVLR